ncbi:tumor necrosis factor receptor superfamily member 1A [Kryptolebias marmoratus]|uniref:Tumor necrosis factor receptor superfamily, member 1a n=1 Tax=Kryptolebias marmoratus TaxID=37003 RepID=A0A3Q3A1R7_KRYMA|nr:tumor necrosis factor receptor superfamily member 1A [Kryptolebias marmoratus]
MMAGTGHQGRCSVAIFLLLVCENISASTPKPDLEKKQCPAGDYVSARNVCCNKCPAGFKLKSECPGEGQRSNCELCPERQFNDKINHFPNCRKCRVCKESNFEYEVSPCKNDRNAVCRCMDGYYKHVIDSGTYDCLRCKECRENERKNQTCTPERNTVCECKENYHRVKNKCEPCRNCTTNCANLCVKVTQVTEAPKGKHNLIINIIAGSAAVVFVLLVVVVFITFVATKRFTKKKMLSQSSQHADVPKETKEHLLVDMNEPAEVISLKATGLNPVNDQESVKLPDCVPLEIRIPDLIYAVLDLVPVSQVKQLARLLGVRDREIEQEETDHRSCREAHYQMLRVWAERGTREGRDEMLHRPLLEELLDKLRQMHLGRAAEELETKYPIQ